MLNIQRFTGRLRRLGFYTRGIHQAITPRRYFQSQRNALLDFLLHAPNRDHCLARIHYYCKNFPLDTRINNTVTLNEVSRWNQSYYAFDLYQALASFPADLPFCYEFGDITKIPSKPTFLKSRPISTENENSVLLKLNAFRHFVPVSDSIPFRKKTNTAVWRGKVHPPQTNRQAFLHQWHAHPDLDIAAVNSNARVPQQALGKPLSIQHQLRHKFVISLEGNDVATNLKWILQSNSLCIMPKPRFETWFCEGWLEAGKHYVAIRDDFSDLEQQMQFYIQHPDKAERIIKNAKEFAKPYQNRKLEQAISTMVVMKYGLQTNPQMVSQVNWHPAYALLKEAS